MIDLASVALRRASGSAYVAFAIRTAGRCPVNRPYRYGARQREISDDLPCCGGAVSMRTGFNPAFTASTNLSISLQTRALNAECEKRGRCTSETNAAKFVRAASMNQSIKSTLPGLESRWQASTR